MLAGMATLAACSGKDASSATAPPPPPGVGYITIEPKTQGLHADLTGRTKASQSAEVRPQVSGILQKRLFTEGGIVKAGQPLYQIDSRSLQATVASAEAALAKARASAQTSKANAARNAELVKIDAISQQVNEQTQAAAEQAEADVAVAKAAEQTARINLARTRIVAPISGWIELSSVTAGALVTADQATPLTTIQQLDPVHVHVTQTSAELLRLKRDLASGQLSRGRADEAPIQLLLEDGSVYPHPGRLTFSGVTVDAGTGSVTLRAVVPNPDRLLMPGMYVRAVLQEGVAEDALLVPQQAVTRAPDGSTTALVVGAEDKLVRRPIVVGRAVSNRWQVLDGLKAGDRVLVEGSQRARPGDLVRASEVVPRPGPAATPPVNGKGGPGPGSVASAGPLAGNRVVR